MGGKKHEFTAAFHLHVLARYRRPRRAAFQSASSTGSGFLCSADQRTGIITEYHLLVPWVPRPVVTR